MAAKESKESKSHLDLDPEFEERRNREIQEMYDSLSESLRKVEQAKVERQGHLELIEFRKKMRQEIEDKKLAVKMQEEADRETAVRLKYKYDPTEDKKQSRPWECEACRNLLTAPTLEGKACTLCRVDECRVFVCMPCSKWYDGRCTQHRV